MVKGRNLLPRSFMLNLNLSTLHMCSFRPLYNPHAIGSTNNYTRVCTSINLQVMTSNESRRNLIIVSNRLPLSIKRVDGTYKSSLSSGGLVTSLSGLCKSTEFQWFGWPGLEVKGTKDIADVENTLSEHHAIPIFLDSGLAHEHYNGFSSMEILQP